MEQAPVTTDVSQPAPPPTDGLAPSTATALEHVMKRPPVECDRAEVEAWQAMSAAMEGQPNWRVWQPPIRSSYVADLHQCPRYFMLKDRLCLRLKGAYSPAIGIGTMYHLMMQQKLGGCTTEEAVQYASRTCTLLGEEAEKLANDQGLLPDGTAVEKTIEAAEQSFSQARLMFELSAPTFLEAPFLKAEGWEPLLVEKVIDIRIKGICARLRCKPDAVLIRPDQALLIVNHKTTSKSPRLLSAVYRYAIQPRIEHLCLLAWCQKALGFRPSMILYLHNVMQVCSLRFPTKANPDWPTYLQSCKMWYDDKQKADPNDPPILQSLMRLPDEPLTGELLTVLRESGRACKNKVNPCLFFRNDKACCVYGKMCEYHRLCNAEFAAWPELLNSYGFVRREDEEDAE